jgi:hypothetical protein
MDKLFKNSAREWVNLDLVPCAAAEVRVWETSVTGDGAFLGGRHWILLFNSKHWKTPNSRERQADVVQRSRRLTGVLLQKEASRVRTQDRGSFATAPLGGGQDHGDDARS